MTRKGRPSRRGLVWILACMSVILPIAAWAECNAAHVDLRGDWGQARFSVEVVDTPETRAQGLMFRESMAQSAGMLFVYQSAQAPTFWMRNTLIPLDMVFARPDGVVQHVHPEAVPLDEETHISGGEGILVVLEINGGVAARFGIAPGTEMRHPAFGADAAWPCPTTDATGG